MCIFGLFPRTKVVVTVALNCANNSLWPLTRESGPCLGEVGAGRSGGVEGRLAGDKGAAGCEGGGDVAGSGGGVSCNNKHFNSKHCTTCDFS